MAKAPVDSDEVVSRLMDYIQREGLSAGDRLPSIRQLATMTGVRSNVIRDALLQAQTLGLVKVHPRSGAFVQSPSFSPAGNALQETLAASLTQGDYNLFHVMDARRLIEVELAGEAAARRRPEDLLPLKVALAAMAESRGDRQAFVEADEKFHLGIARIAGNEVLLMVLRTLFVLLRPYKRTLMPTSQGQSHTDRLHMELYRSILEGESDRARAAMREHLGEIRDYHLSMLYRVEPETEDASPVAAREEAPAGDPAV